MWKRATSFRQFYNNLKRSFTSGNIENQIRNLDPIQATNWTEWCASQRFLLQPIPFLREELILLRNLFHSCLNPCCMQKKFPSLRFPFRYISTNPPEIPSFAFTGAKFLIIFFLRGNRPVLEDVNSRCKFYAPHDAPCKSDSSSRVPSIQFFNFYTPLLKLEHRL